MTATTQPARKGAAIRRSAQQCCLTVYSYPGCILHQVVNRRARKVLDLWAQRGKACRPTWLNHRVPISQVCAVLQLFESVISRVFVM